MTQITRRKFVAGAAAVTGATALTDFNLAASGPSANSKLNLAFIGGGGRGSRNLNACKDENVVAICDVSDEMAAKSRAKFPKAQAFKDFRVMLDKIGKEIDAVVVSTPDHTHFVATMAAMQAGKHVYVEKPLAHNIWQLRTLRKAARHYNVVTQMGNQGHASDGIRQIKELTEAGVLGEVTHVDAWLPGPNHDSRFFLKPSTFPPKQEKVPSDLDWDLWIGPAPMTDYSHYLAPAAWRCWWDYGCGLLGDWACHTVDAPFYALDLGTPLVVEAEQRDDSHEDYIPSRSIVRFEFPARGDMPPVTLRWYEGGLRPEPRQEWQGKKMRGMAMVMTGNKGSIVTGGRPNTPQLVDSKADWERPDETIPRIEGQSPHAEWIAHIKGEGPSPGSNFDYASELTEFILLGVLAQRFNTRIEWDAENMKVTNNPELNAYVKEPVRKGWEYGEEL